MNIKQDSDYPWGELDDEEILPSGVVGGVFSSTRDGPPSGRTHPGRCIANA